MSGGGGGTTTVQKADPWSGSQAYLKQMYQGASNAYANTPQYYPNSTVAPLSPETQQALSGMWSRSFGSPLETQAQNQTSAIASGQDWLSQFLGNQAQGGGAQNAGLTNVANGNTQGQSALMGIMGGYSPGQQTLSSVMNGSDSGQQILAGLAQGQGTTGGVLNYLASGGGLSGQSYQNIINGNTTQDAALNKIIGGTDTTSQYLKGVLGGQYLNGNPYLSQMVSAANSDTTRDFKNAVMPQLASQFSLAGRYGSGAQSQGINDASLNLAKTLTNNATNIYGQNYATERGNQNAAASTLGQYLLSGIGQRSSNVMGATSGLYGQQAGASTALGALMSGAAGQYTGNRLNAAGGYNSAAAGAAGGYNSAALNALGTLSNNMSGAQGLLSGRQGAAIAALPGMAAIDWQNLQKRAAVGDYRDQYAQQMTDADKARWDYQQQIPWSQLQNYNSILSGSMALNGQTQTAPGRSPLAGALGGAMGGAALGSAIMPGIGTGIGALGGAALSMLHVI